MPRRDAGKIDISSACEPGIIGPETAPCSTRNAISDSKLQAMPHRNDAMVNSATLSDERAHDAVALHQATRSAARKCRSTTANEVMIQVPWLVLTPRLPAMVGSDTFAIVVSSTCMKVPSASAKAVSPRVPAGSAISGRSWLGGTGGHQREALLEFCAMTRAIVDSTAGSLAGWAGIEAATVLRRHRRASGRPGRAGRLRRASTSPTRSGMFRGSRPGRARCAPARAARS